MKGSRTIVAARVSVLILASFLPRMAVADGMVIPQRGYALPDIPDQSALIYFTTGSETLVIETSFKGQGTNFAWVVPLPTVPTIEPVSTGLFPTLRTIFQPRVVLSVKHYLLALPAAVLFLFGVSVARRCSFDFLVVLLLLLVVVSLFVPALQLARSRAGAAGTTFAGVQVLARRNVGLIDTATIKPRDANSLLQWLNENGFKVPTNITTVVTDYVREGWIFVAARLRQEAAGSGLTATHPLCFKFPTAKPVYPLRLTGVATKSCRIDLFVFGPGRAKAPGFKLRRCQAPTYGARFDWPQMVAGDIRMRHKELTKLVPKVAVATKLSAVLSASEMNHDAYLRWTSYWPSGGKVYSRGAALILSCNVSALLFMTLTSVWWLLARARSAHGIDLGRLGAWLAPVSILMGIAVYGVAVPKVSPSSLRLTKGFAAYAMNDALQLALEIEDKLGESNAFSQTAPTSSALSPLELETLLQEIRHEARIYSGNSTRMTPFTNFFTGEPIRFEASPGNVILRPATNDDVPDWLRLKPGSWYWDYELVWHDLDGAEAFRCPVQPARSN
jgi:hypothetical protein